MGSYEEKAAKYRKLAKKLDERLRQIEIRAGNDVNIGIIDYAYQMAMYSLRQLQGSKETYRFNRKPPTDEKELDRWLKAAERFEQAKSSTISGYKKIEKDRVATINEKFNTDFTVDDLKKAFDSGFFANMSEQYGSKTAWKTTGVMQRNEQQLKEAVETARTKHKNISKVIKDMNLKDEKGKSIDSITRDIIENEIFLFVEDIAR